MSASKPFHHRLCDSITIADIAIFRLCAVCNESERRTREDFKCLFSNCRLLPRQGRPWSHGAQHAFPLGPGTEERWTRSRVQAEVRHGGMWQDGPGRRDRGHRQHRTEEVLGVSEEGGPGGGGLLPGSEHGSGLTRSTCFSSYCCPDKLSRSERSDAHPSPPTLCISPAGETLHKRVNWIKWARMAVCAFSPTLFFCPAPSQKWCFNQEVITSAKMDKKAMQMWWI